MVSAKVHLTGPFRIIADAGTVLTPNGAKECGLIALLALSPGGKRARTWLQAKLWSDRGREQAAGSLRQALTRLRKIFGEDHPILLSDRRHVWLNLDLVQCLEEPGFEFLEGLDVRDEEFEHWLSAERSARDIGSGNTTPAQTAVPASATPRILPNGLFSEASGLRCIEVRLSPNRSSESWWAERLVADVIARSLSEDFSFPIVQSDGAFDTDAGWCVAVDGLASRDGEFNIRIGLSDRRFGRQIWSSHRVIRNLGSFAVDNPEILQVAHELSSAISSKVMLDARGSELPEDPDVYCAAAIRKLFSMRAEDMEQADRLFACAAELQPRGSLWAWRSQLREMQYMQRFRTDRASLQEECEELMRKAMELEPDSSIVLSLLANTRLYIGRDTIGSLELARRSVRINPGNPMAWWALSSAHLMRSERNEAHRAAQMVHHLTMNSELAFFAKGQLAGTAIALGKFREATELLQSATAYRSNYRPGWRYLIALHATDNNWEAANAARNALERIEPTFSIDRMIGDADYPVSLLRGDYGLSLEHVSELG